MALTDRIQKIINGVDDAVRIAKSTSAQMIFVEIDDRVFTRGLDHNNNQIGQYKPSTKKIRVKKGQQISKVDLTDTTSLNKSVMNGEDKVYFKNEYGSRVMGYNEAHFQKRIASPSEGERKIFYDNVNNEINKLFSGN
jgi:hypothetical protein